MLKFSVRADTVGRGTGGRWQLAGDRWVLGESFVEPYRNIALESAAFLDGTALVVIVRERVHGAPAFRSSRELDSMAVHRHVEETARWAADFVVIRIDHEVIITAGQWGAAPLYLCDDGVRLTGSWDVTDLRHRLRVDELDAREVVAQLTLSTAYSSRTVFTGIRHLTERAQARWSPDRPLAIRYPEPGVHYGPRTLRPDARPVEVYDGLLRSAVTRRPLRSTDVVAEVSGGTDSATVALSTARELDGDLAAYGLLVGGVAAAQQIMRRTSLVALAGLRDNAVDAMADAPIAMSDARRPTFPGEEPYGAAVTAALDLVDRPVVFTGIGGDELFALRPDERSSGRTPMPPLPAYLSSSAHDLAEQLRHDPPEIPVSIVPESVLQACGVRAPTFLRAGRWPIAPLCAPELIRFGEWLPASWRRGKLLPRVWLSAHGVPDEVVWPRLRENFDPVMQYALRRHGLAQLHDLVHRGSVLVELGYLDGAALAEQLSAASNAFRSGSPINGRLHELLVMESFVRSLSS